MTVTVPIPQSDPRASYLAQKPEIDNAIAKVLNSGRYILGEEVLAFEAEFAAYIGVKFAIGVGSGTEALHLALRACGIGPGNEVITVSHTAVATVAAIELCGATPVLVDIDPVTLTIDPNSVEDAVKGRRNRRVKGIIPVHLYGHPADMESIIAVAQRYGLRVIEDCAQSHGATLQGRKTGSWGDIAAFSFYPTKNLGALGDGGAVVTDDPQLAECVRLLREYGWAQRFVSQFPGCNSRLDELQATILRVKLRFLDQRNERRGIIAGVYSEHLQGLLLKSPVCRSEAVHVYHQYVVRSKKRDVLRSFLREWGISSSIHYPVPVHLQPAYQGRTACIGSLDKSVAAASQVLSLPMYPELSQEQAIYICGVISDWHRRCVG